MTTQKILSINDICQLVQRNRKTLWTWVHQGLFPQPIKMNGRTIGWPESSYQQWLNEKVVEKS